MTKVLGHIGTIVSVTGISVASLFSGAYQSHLSAGVIFICVGYLTFRGHQTLSEVLKRRYPSGYKPIATFYRYSTSDGKIGVFENFRHIQIKKPLMTSFSHGFYWTGSSMPKITSAIQEVGEVKNNGEGRETSVDLKFRECVIYDSAQIVHTRMEVDDSDEKAEPYIALKITQPMQLIHFRVELLHAKPQHYAQKAFVERKSIYANSAAKFDQIAIVDMNPAMRAYEYIIAHPDPEFQYRLRWERITQTRAQKRAAKVRA